MKEKGGIPESTTLLDDKSVVHLERQIARVLGHDPPMHVGFRVPALYVVLQFAARLEVLPAEVASVVLLVWHATVVRDTGQKAFCEFD